MTVTWPAFWVACGISTVISIASRGWLGLLVAVLFWGTLAAVKTARERYRGRHRAQYIKSGSWLRHAVSKGLLSPNQARETLYGPRDLGLFGPQWGHYEHKRLGEP